MSFSTARLTLLIATMFLFAVVDVSTATELDRILGAENAANKVDLKPAPVVDDLTFLRRATTDLIGRIPTLQEIREYESWPAATRREQVVDQLIKHDRFADRWMTFYADMLRARSNVEGGAALLAFLHRAIQEDTPYDELVRGLIVTNGKAGRTPEVGFLLGDDADPMALASATAQVFMGVRMGCAQCHDHPFDVWKQEEFYGLAAFYGKVRRVEQRLTRVIYTTEQDRMTILWPPEGDAPDNERKAMMPKFPIKLDEQERPAIARLVALRTPKELKPEGPSVDDLLADSDNKVKKTIKGDGDSLGILDDAKSQLNKIDIKSNMYGRSELREDLAKFVTSPRNRYFSRSFANRVWAELVGRGIVDPVDDFREDNQPSHPQTLDYLADEFVANGFDLKKLIKMVVMSDAYQREHVNGEKPDYQYDMENAFLATPMRRVLSEALFDSVIAAGHLFEVKHKPGKNEKIVTETVRVRIDDPNGKTGEKPAAILTQGGAAMMKDTRMAAMGGYNLESAVELDFDKLLMAKDDEVTVDQMRVMSLEEVEAMQIVNQRATPNMKYETKTVERVVDDNPSFNSAFRMASPAPAGHFLRVFGQTSRARLDDKRDESPSMRQALMMLNGRMTNEASRVGELEPIYKLMVGEKANLDEAIKLAYVEILTRVPTDEEIADAKFIIGDAKDHMDGMADLRWVLLNCNEFRYLR